jgi:hypothetical protein
MPLLLGASIVISGVSALMGWFSNRSAAKAQRKAAEADAELQDYNADVADIQAQDALERGEVEADKYGAAVRRMVGAQRANYATQGVDVSSGTPMDVQADTAQWGEINALQIKSNAAREAWGYKVEAYDSRKRAMFERKEGLMLQKAGNTAAWASVVAAAGQGVSAGANYYAMRYGFPQSGAGGTASTLPGTGIPVFSGTQGGNMLPAPRLG